MRQIPLLTALTLALACGACSNATPSQTAAGEAAVTIGVATAATVNPQVAAWGTLFCQIGPKVVAVSNVKVPGQTAAYVAAACAAVDPAATPVGVPATSTPVPVVTVPTK
jgi:hypothetical protein